MKNNIKNHTELKLRLLQLDKDKVAKEAIIGQNARDIAEWLNPVNILKRTLASVAKDKELRLSFLRTLLTRGINKIVEKVVNKEEEKKDEKKGGKGILATIINRFIRN